MTYVQGETFDEVYIEACRAIHNFGQTVQTRGKKLKEIRNIHIYLTDPRHRLLNVEARKMSYRYLVGEMCFYLSGTNSVDQIAHYAPFWRRASDDGKTVQSAYGHTIFTQYGNQFERAVLELHNDPGSRRAVIITLTPESVDYESNDIPCTAYIHLMIRDDQLHATNFMRSNDVWRGFTYDLPFFTFLQEMALVRLWQLGHLEYTLGSYTHIAGSFHAYWNHVERVSLAAHEIPDVEARTMMPAVSDYDVRSWFSDLLVFEEQRRQGATPSREALTTMFQHWCMDQLI